MKIWKSEFDNVTHLKRRALTAMVVIALSAPLPAFAQDGSGGLSFNIGQSRRVASIMQDQFDECHEVEIVYRPDCYRDAFTAGASVIKNNAAYWEVEVALTRVGRDIYNYVKRNRDPDASTSGYFGSGHKAIFEINLPEARARIATWMGEAEAFLRSGSSTEVKFFTPIADVLRDNSDIN